MGEPRFDVSAAGQGRKPFKMDSDFNSRREEFYARDRLVEETKPRKKGSGYIEFTKDEAKDRLEGLRELFRGELTITEITEFPQDLKLPDRVKTHLYVGPENDRKLSGRVCRIDVGTVTMLVHLRDDQYFAGDVYENGEYWGGNHDFEISEIISFLTRFAERPKTE